MINVAFSTIEWKESLNLLSKSRKSLQGFLDLVGTYVRIVCVYGVRKLCVYILCVRALLMRTDIVNVFNLIICMYTFDFYVCIDYIVYLDLLYV